MEQIITLIADYVTKKRSKSGKLIGARKDLKEIESLLLPSRDTCVKIIDMIESCLLHKNSSEHNKRLQNVLRCAVKTNKKHENHLLELTTNKIINNEIRVKSLTKEQCDAYVDLFKCKRYPERIKEARAKIKKRLAYIEFITKSDKSFSSLFLKLKTFHELFLNIPIVIENIKQSKDYKHIKDLLLKYNEEPPSLDLIIHRILGTTLFDVTVVPLGLVSKARLEQRKKDVKGTYSDVTEHFYSRGTVAGPAILKFLKSEDAKNFDKFIEHMFVFSQIVIVTAHENGPLLRPQQKIGVWKSPKDSYEKAGIELVRVCFTSPPEAWVRVFKYRNLKIPSFYDFGELVVKDISQ